MSLHHLIKDAALDPYLVMRLHMDPEAVAKDYDLTERDMTLLETRNKRAISEGIPPWAASTKDARK